MRIPGFAASGIATALLLASPAARALDCAHAENQSDLTECSGDRFTRADAALNAVYGHMAQDPALADRLAKLRTAERAWVAYRKAQCDFEGSRAEGGSMQPMLEADCASALTERRTKDLTGVLACTHDATC